MYHRFNRHRPTRQIRRTPVRVPLIHTNRLAAGIRAGVNVIMADSSLRFVTDDIALVTWRAMGTMNGSEVIDSN